MDYRELNKVTRPLYAASIAALMDTPSHELGTYHYVVDLANAFFSIDIAQESQEQFAFTWEGQHWTFTLLSQEYFPQFYHLSWSPLARNCKQCSCILH